MDGVPPGAHPVTDGPLPVPDRIETERLLMRPWLDGDAEALGEALAESVSHLLPWIPWALDHAPTPEECHGLLRTWMDQRAAGANCIYATFQRADGRLVGGVGLYRRVGPDALEIGYWLRASAAGLGYATETTRALTDAGLAVPGVRRMEIHLDPANRASARVPEKLGYTLVETREGTHEGRPRTTAVYVLAPAP